MGACACGHDNGINIGKNAPTDCLRLGRSQGLPHGYSGKVMRAWLAVALPNTLVGIIWEYARELEVCFPPKGRPIAARYIHRPSNRLSSSDCDNLWEIPEISCSLVSRNNHLHCQLIVRNPKYVEHAAVSVWNGPLLDYGAMSNKTYFEENTTLMALEANSTIFAKPWRSTWEREILKHNAIRGIEHIVPIILDGMHELWMLEMTRQW